MYIADRGFYGQELCSCGRPFGDCDFWTAVMRRVTAEDIDAWFARFKRLQIRVARRRSLPRLALAQLFPTRTRAESAYYSEMLGHLIEAICQVGEAEVVVDSSKEPVHGFHVSRSSVVALETVHLVRDCRAVTYSLQRARVRHEVHQRTAYMAQISVSRSAIYWVVLNVLTEVLGKATGRYLRVRYEDLASQPASVVGALLDDSSFECITGSPPIDLEGQPTGHEVSGNPMRFEPVGAIAPDTRWVGGLSGRDFALSTALGGALLRRYGYPLSRGSREN
jgi:hypothetical protein